MVRQDSVEVCDGVASVLEIRGRLPSRFPVRVANPLDEVFGASAIAALADDAVDFEQLGAVLEGDCRRRA